MHRGRRKAVTDAVARQRTLPPRKQRVNRWYRKPQQLLAVTLALLLVVGFGIYRVLSAGTASAPHASESGRPTPSSSSGHPSRRIPWMSGVSYPDPPDPIVAAEATQAFGSWRGDDVGVVVAWPLRGTWADFTQVNSFYTIWAQQPYTKAFGIPLFPENVGATVGACIAGSYDDQWRTFADTMNSTGLAAQGTIIRLGWEFNQTPQWAARHSSPPASGRSSALSARSLLVWSGTGMSTAVPAARCQATAS